MYRQRPGFFACSRLIGDQSLPAKMRADALVRRALMTEEPKSAEWLADLEAAFKLTSDTEILILRAFLRGSHNDAAGMNADLKEIKRLQPSATAGYVLIAFFTAINSPVETSDAMNRLAELEKGIALPNMVVHPNVQYLMKRKFGFPAFNSWHTLAYLLMVDIYEKQGDRERRKDSARKAVSNEPGNMQLRGLLDPWIK